MFVTCWGPYDASGLHNCIKVAADFDLRYLDYGLPLLALGLDGKTTIECGLFISCLFVCSFCCNGLIFGLQTTQQPPSITLLSKATRCMKRRSRSLEPRASLAPTGWGPKSWHAQRLHKLPCHKLCCHIWLLHRVAKWKWIGKVAVHLYFDLSDSGLVWVVGISHYNVQW